MEPKGNRIENWEHQYKPLEVTYTEETDTPVDLEQMYSYQFVHEHIVNHLHDSQSAKILEVGCGGARNALYLARQGFDVTCSDFAPEGIRLAQTNFNAFGTIGTFLLDDLMNSKIPDNSFDCVMSFGLLEHFNELKPVIRNLTNMVKPDGLQIHLAIPKKFSTQVIMNLIWFPYSLTKNILRMQPLQGIIKRSYRDFPHYENSFSWEEYCGAFEEEGNDIIKCEPGGIILPFILRPNLLGKAIVRLFSKQIISMNDVVKRSTFPLTYFFSTTFTVVCRKK
jgi:2-polyprenyl-3-methyl-5-hydroxy-6-metoxy-1,4-benzoquinol methylase